MRTDAVRLLGDVQRQRAEGVVAEVRLAALVVVDDHVERAVLDPPQKARQVRTHPLRYLLAFLRRTPEEQPVGGDEVTVDRDLERPAADERRPGRGGDRAQAQPRRVPELDAAGQAMSRAPAAASRPQRCSVSARRCSCNEPRFEMGLGGRVSERAAAMDSSSRVTSRALPCRALDEQGRRRRARSKRRDTEPSGTSSRPRTSSQRMPCGSCIGRAGQRRGARFHGYRRASLRNLGEVPEHFDRVRCRGRRARRRR